MFGDMFRLFVRSFVRSSMLQLYIVKLFIVRKLFESDNARKQKLAASSYTFNHTVLLAEAPIPATVLLILLLFPKFSKPKSKSYVGGWIWLLLPRALLQLAFNFGSFNLDFHSVMSVDAVVNVNLFESDHEIKNAVV
jgi:hypothetical protein